MVVGEVEAVAARAKEASDEIVVRSRAIKWFMGGTGPINGGAWKYRRVASAAVSEGVVVSGPGRHPLVRVDGGIERRGQ